MIRIVLLGVWIVALSTAAWAAKVNVATADGQTRPATLQSIRPEGAAVQFEGGGVEMIALNRLAKLTFDNAAQTSPPGRVVLRDDSSIAINSVELAAGAEQIRLELRRQDSLALPLASVASIRFRPPSLATDAVWLGLVSQATRSDRLVARRDDNLETIEGPVSAIGRQTVSFEMAGGSIDAPLTKLEGVILAGGGNPAQNASIRVRDVVGSVWQVASMVTSDDAKSLRLTLGSGVEHVIALDQLLEIEFQGGILNLVTAEVAGSKILPTVGFSIASVPLGDWFGPRIDGDSITMNGPGEITFRVPEGFTRIVGSVRRPADVNQFGKSSVVIRLDDKNAWSMNMADATALGFDVPLDASRRITLQLSSDGDSSLGDSASWINVRLLK